MRLTTGLFHMGKQHVRRLKWLWIPIAALTPAIGAALTVLPVRYVEETIRVRVQIHAIEVTGTYEYENPWPIPGGLVLDIPVPVDADHLAPSRMSAAVVNGNEQSVRVFRLLGHSCVLLWFRPNATTCLKVYYEQEMRVNNACYLITTTQSWGRPLKKAAFRLDADGVRITDSSYRLEPREDGTVGFERTDFMPTMDWTFAWEAL